MWYENEKLLLAVLKESTDIKITTIKECVVQCQSKKLQSFTHYDICVKNVIFFTFFILTLLNYDGYNDAYW